MSDARPWGPMDPNSQHQLWSDWTFEVHEHGRRVPRRDVERNMSMWFRLGFGSVGQFKVEPLRRLDRDPNRRLFWLSGWTVRLQIEGVPAHDRAYVERVCQQFQARFVAQGWGPLAESRVHVAILAGDVQDGKPASQLIVMPTIMATALP